MTLQKRNYKTIETMQDKRKLNNGVETIAVTSFLSFTYKPIKQVHAFDDYVYPSGMCSKNGKLDTSKKFIKIGGGNKMFLTNNHYGDYGKYLKQKHVKMNSNKKSSCPCDSQISNSGIYDAKKADTDQQIEFCEPKIKKEFVYRRDRKNLCSSNLTKDDFLRTDEEGLNIIRRKEKQLRKIALLKKSMYASDDNDSDDELGFWNKTDEHIQVQGFDEKTKQYKVLKQIDRFTALNKSKVSYKEDVKPTSVELNERNQVAEQIRKNVSLLQKEIEDLVIFREYIEDKLRNEVQGGTFSSVTKMNDIINTAHHELVEKKTLENASGVVGSLGVLTSALEAVVNAVVALVDGIKGYIETILNTINNISPIASTIINILSKALIIHFASHFITKACFGIELSVLEFVGVLYAVMIKCLFQGDNSWTETVVTTCLCIFSNTMMAYTHKDRLRVESKDLFVIPFSICMGMGLLASGKHSFSENFISSIKGFGGILAFSSKCDSIIRGIADIVPQVFVEYFRYYFPRIYEYMILGWKDTDFQKDLQELIKLIAEPDSIYYSSHKVKQFLDLVNRFKDIYIKKYGHFSFFSTSPIFDKVDCIYEEVKRRGLVPGKRHCPYVVWIAGDSGVGKSSLAQYLAAQFIDKDLDYSKQVYTWNPALEFQDGYNHQPVVIINDYMQTTDHGEEQILISIKDACDWTLNSSSNDDIINGKKGEMRFTSKLIIITSNVTYLHSSNYIRETQAFNRRRDILVEMKFKGSAQFDFVNTDYSWCSFTLKDPCMGLNRGTNIEGVSALISAIEVGYKEHYDKSLDRISYGLRIQSDEENYEDIREPGFLKSIIIKRAQEIKQITFDFVKEHYKVILAGISVFGVSAYVLAKILMKLPLVQAFNSGDSNTIVKIHPKVMERFKAQSETEDHDNKQLKIIENNMYRVSTCIIVDERSTIRSVTGTYIGNDVLLLPRHLFSRGTNAMKKGEMMIINKGNIIYETTFEPERLTPAGEDYCFYNVSLIMPRQKNISHFFDNGVEPLDKEISCMILRLDPNGTAVNQIITPGYFVPSVTCYDDVADSSREYVGNTMIRARANLQSGDCGALIGIRVNGNYKIFGIHVGGLSGVNYFQLTNVSKYVKEKDRVVPIRGFVESVDFDHTWGQFLVQGKVESSSFPFSNNASRISPSICYEILQPHTTEPAVLSVSDPRNPEHQSMLHNGTIGIGKMVKPINCLNFSEIIQYMRIKHRCLYGDYRLLTLSESINGIEGLDRIDFSTSPGYPYTVGSQGVSFRKTDFFVFNGKIWEPTPAFHHEFNKFIEESKTNGIPMIWTNCVKDERRPINKILKSRIFTISNIMLTILGRQIFGQYVERYSRTRHEHGGMIGINPYSSEWSILFDYLNEFKSANDGDFSKFDKDLLKEIFQLFSIFIKEIIPNDSLYGMKVHDWIDEILYCTLFSDTLTILDGIKVLITSLHGNPSGWFLTVFFNDFANKVYLYSVWQRIFKYQIPLPENRIKAFFDNVRDVYYGDDNLYTVSDEFKDKFNAETVAIHLLDMYNIVYTSGDKGDIVSYNKPLMECTFLKNHFVLQEGVIVAGLDKNTIQEMVSWTRDKDKSLQQILETCLRYSYFWGVDYFNNNRRKLIKFSSKLPTYLELDFEFKNNGGLNFEIYSKNEEQRYLELLHKINKTRMFNNKEIIKSELVDNVKIMNKQIKVQSKDTQISNGLRDNEPVTEEIRNYGVNMVNQNIRIEENIYNRASKVQIPEIANNLKTLLSRPLLVKNIEVSSNTLGPVTSLVFPQDWIAISRNVQDIADAYFLFKGKIKMQVTIQSTPFNAGAMVAHASYKDSSSFDTGSLTNVENAWIRPHCELDYSDNAANAIMDIPWKYKREYCEFSAVGADGIVDIFFDNYLPNTSSARLMVYLWIEDADVVVTKTKRITVQGITLFGDSITNVTTNQQIGEVAGNVMPNNIKGDQFDTSATLNLSALDQPNITIEPSPILAKREPYSSNAVQIQHKEKLALYPKEQLMSTFDTFGTNEDEMSIDYLKSKWSLGGLTFPTSPAIKYTTISAPFTVLAAGNVGPYGGGTMAFNKSSETPYFTFLDYISKNHTLWRGTRGKDGVLEYRFKFACNRFQSGRVAVIYNPVATWFDFFGTYDTTSPTLNPDQLGACYVAYFDINGQDNEIIVRLPFVSASPWKVCWTGLNNECPSSLRQSILRNSFAGVIALVAITPLVSPEGSPTEINVASFIRGAPGYQIAVNSTKNNSVGFKRIATVSDATNNVRTSSVNPALLQKLRVQSATINLEDKKKSKIKIDCWEILRQLIRLPKVEFELPYYHLKEEVHVQSKDYVFLGEEIECAHGDSDILPTTSLRDLMKKMVLTARFANPLAVSNINYNQSIDFSESTEIIRLSTLYTVPLFPFPGYSQNLIGDLRVPSWFNIMGMYQGYRGGFKMRVRVCIDRSSIREDTDAELNREIKPFHCIIFLDDTPIGTAYRYEGVGSRSVQTLPLLLNAYNTSNGGISLSQTHDFGILAMESNIANEIDIDFEVPAHLFNKYHEVNRYDSTASDPNESRPFVRIYVYQDTAVRSTDLNRHDIVEFLEWKPLRQAILNTQIKVEVFTSISDEGRCGVLDEYPRSVTNGTDIYVSESGMPTQSTVALVPTTTYP